MNTHEITQSLKLAVANHAIPSLLADEIGQALARRDELRAAVVWESQRVDALHLAQAQDAETIASLRAERDEAISLLSRIAAEVTRTAVLGGYAYEIDGVLVGEIDAVLQKMDAGKGE